MSRCLFEKKIECSGWEKTYFVTKGDPWEASKQVDLDISISGEGADAQMIRFRPWDFEACYWGGIGDPLCHSLAAGDETSRLPMARPEGESGLAELTAWIQSTAEVDFGVSKRRIASSRLWLWSDREKAARALRKRMAAAGGLSPNATAAEVAADERAAKDHAAEDGGGSGPGAPCLGQGQTAADLQLLRQHLAAAMKDSVYLTVSSYAALTRHMN
jgi:hypothetical protein